MGMSEKQLQEMRSKIETHLKSGGSADARTALDLLYPDRVTPGVFELEFKAVQESLKPKKAAPPADEVQPANDQE